MSKDKIQKEHSVKIQALAESGGYTYQDICNAFDDKFTINQIKYHVNKYYPETKNIKKEYSRGGSKLEALLKGIFPYDKIVAEYAVGNKLRVDFVVLPPYNLAFEFDGAQHGKYTSHFHGDTGGFWQSQQRDLEKEERCKGRGLNLIRIDSLDIDLEILNLLIKKVGYGSGTVDEKFLTYKERVKLKQEQNNTLKTQALKARGKKQQELVKSNPSKDSYENKMKEKQKEYRKEQYKRQKEWLKKNKK